MFAFVKISCLFLAILAVCAGCKNEIEEKNLATKKILAQHCADFVPESALDMNPNSTLFLGSPQALDILICQGDPRNSGVWEQILQLDTLITNDMTASLPWADSVPSLDRYKHYATAARNVPKEQRTSSMPFLEKQLNSPEHPTSLETYPYVLLPELGILRNLALLTGADFVQSALRKNDGEMLAINRRLRNLRDVASKGSALGILVGDSIENIRLKYWNWAIGEGLLSDQLLETKPFLKNPPEYRKLRIYSLYLLEMEKECFFAAYSANSKKFQELMGNSYFSNLPQKIDLSETLVPDLVHFRVQLAEMVTILADPKISDLVACQTINAKFPMPKAESLLEAPFTLYHEIKIYNSLFKSESFAKLTSLACDIARYRKDNGKLPTSLNDLVPTYCSELPKNHLNALPELVAGVSDEGRQEVYLQYPSDRNPNRQRIVFDPNR